MLHIAVSLQTTSRLFSEHNTLDSATSQALFGMNPGEAQIEIYSSIDPK
jgi:hypothetical protein